MKKLIILAILTPIFTLVNALNIDNISKRIDIINKQKEISSKIDYNVYDPFASAKPIISESKKIEEIEPIIILPIIVQTILNNKVLINGKWHKTGDTVQGSVIKQINQKYIVVLRNKKKTLLTIKSNKSIIKTKEIIQ